MRSARVNMIVSISILFYSSLKSNSIKYKNFFCECTFWSPESYDRACYSCACIQLLSLSLFFSSIPPFSLSRLLLRYLKLNKTAQTGSIRDAARCNSRVHLPPPTNAPHLRARTNGDYENKRVNTVNISFVRHPGAASRSLFLFAVARSFSLPLHRRPFSQFSIFCLLFRWLSGLFAPPLPFAYNSSHFQRLSHFHLAKFNVNDVLCRTVWKVGARNSHAMTSSNVTMNIRNDKARLSTVSCTIHRRR